MKNMYMSLLEKRSTCMSLEEFFLIELKKINKKNQPTKQKTTTLELQKTS